MRMLALFLIATASQPDLHAQPGGDKHQDCLNKPHQAQVFLSDNKKSAYHWLEKKQRNIYGEDAKPLTLEELITNVEKRPAQMDRGDMRSMLCDAAGDIVLPTRYESIGPYLSLKRASDLIRSGLTKNGEVAPDVLLGTLPIKETNAATHKRGKEYVILTNHQILNTIYSLTLIANRTAFFTPAKETGAISAISTDSSTVRDRLKKNPALLKSYHESLVAFANKTPHPILDSTNAFETFILSTQIDGMHRFIVGHEYAHILLNHVSSTKRNFDIPTTKGGSERIIMLGYDWPQEILADLTSLSLMQVSRIEEGKPDEELELLSHALFTYSAVLYLVLTDALSSEVKNCTTGKTGSYSNTPETLRKSILEDVMGQLSRSNSLKISEEHATALSCRGSASHPPQWLRAEILLQTIDQAFEEGGVSEAPEVKIARSIIVNAYELERLRLEAAP